VFVLFLAIGGWYGYRSWSLAHGGGVADAMQANDSDNSTTYAPLVEYRVGDQRYTLTGSSSSPPAHHVGQKVRVRYGRADPGPARLDDFKELGLLPLLFIPLALLMGLMYNDYVIVGLARQRLGLARA
jgi:Protein of unknown function (DUF3592)